MPYIGRAATNAGSVNYLDDISSGFDGSDTTFTCAISGTTITPGQENVFIYLDGVFQDPGSSKAYTISGSTITFTEAPANGTVFTGYVAGEGAYLDDGTVSTAKLDDDAVTASKLDDDGTGFQVGDLGVGGSLTSGDKLTVTGRLRASGGILGDLTGNVTGNTSGTAATVTGAAQSAITSVGTLSSLTVSGVASLGNNSKATSSSADTTFKIETTSGSTIFPILDFVSSHSSVGGKIRQDGSDVISFDNSQNTTFAGNLTTSEDKRISIGTWDNSGFTGSNAYGLSIDSELPIVHMSDTDTNKKAFFGLSGDNMYIGGNPVDDMIFQTGSGVERLRIRSSSTNWCLDVTSPSPYGMQITTTASNSSSHDMFKIKRGDGTACITTWGDGNTKVENEIQTKAGLRTYATNGANPSGDFYNVAHKFATYKQVLTSSHITDGYVTFSNGIYRDNVLGIIANYFGYASGTNNNYSGYNSAYITRTDYYASNVARAYLGSSATAGDFVYLTIIYHGNTG